MACVAEAHRCSQHRKYLIHTLTAYIAPRQTWPIVVQYQALLVIVLSPFQPLLLTQSVVPSPSRCSPIKCQSRVKQLRAGGHWAGEVLSQADLSSLPPTQQTGSPTPAALMYVTVVKLATTPGCPSRAPNHALRHATRMLVKFIC